MCSVCMCADAIVKGGGKAFAMCLGSIRFDCGSLIAALRGRSESRNQNESSPGTLLSLVCRQVIALLDHHYSYL